MQTVASRRSLQIARAVVSAPSPRLHHQAQQRRRRGRCLIATLILAVASLMPAAAAAAGISMYNIEGYAAASVTGGGYIAETDARYRRVTTPAGFIAALRAARTSSSTPVKVIEIANDLDMGWNEVNDAARADGLLRQNKATRR